MELAGGAPFISGPDLKPISTRPFCSGEAADAIVRENEKARIDGLRASLSLLALIALIALFASRRIPTQQPSAAAAGEPAGEPAA